MVHEKNLSDRSKIKDNNQLIRLDKPHVLKTLDEIESFSRSSDKFQIHYEFFKNFNSESTRQAYYLDLKHFFAFFKIAFKKTIRHPRQVKRFHVVAYKEFLSKAGTIEGTGCAPKTIGRRLGCLNSYFKFLMEKSLIEINPVEGIKRPRQEVVQETNFLTDDQVKALLNSLSTDTLQNALYRAVLYILFGTGIRVSELVNIRFQDYFKKGTYKVLKIFAKGGKIRHIPIKHEVAMAIEDYIKKYKKEGHRWHREDFLIRPTRNNATGVTNKGLNRSTVYRIIKKCCENIGIFDRVSPHTARATLITSLLAKNIDLYKVSLSVGHENPKTTKNYDKRRRALQESALFDVDYF